eukprot:132495_1
MEAQNVDTNTGESDRRGNHWMIGDVFNTKVSDKNTDTGHEYEFKRTDRLVGTLIDYRDRVVFEAWCHKDDSDCSHYDISGIELNVDSDCVHFDMFAMMTDPVAADAFKGLTVCYPWKQQAKTVDIDFPYPWIRAQKRD